MGCKQTTTAAATATKIPSNGTNYIKGVLKKPPLHAQGKTEKLVVKKKPSTLNKSVNFNEKVQVKSRTPTPKQLKYETKTLVETRRPSSSSTQQTDDDDQEVSSISSQEESHLEQLGMIPPSQRTQSNGLWPKSNSIGIISAKAVKRDRTPPPVVPLPVVPVSKSIYPADYPTPPIGKRFKVRRKSPDPTTIPVVTLSPTPIESSPLPVNSFVAVPTKLPMVNDRSASQNTSYAFPRRTQPAKS